MFVRDLILCVCVFVCALSAFFDNRRPVVDSITTVNHHFVSVSIGSQINNSFSSHFGDVKQNFLPLSVSLAVSWLNSHTGGHDGFVLLSVFCLLLMCCACWRWVYLRSNAFGMQNVRFKWEQRVFVWMCVCSSKIATEKRALIRPNNRMVKW